MPEHLQHVRKLLHYKKYIRIFYEAFEHQIKITWGELCTPGSTVLTLLLLNVVFFKSSVSITLLIKERPVIWLLNMPLLATLGEASEAVASEPTIKTRTFLSHFDYQNLVLDIHMDEPNINGDI